MRRIVIIATLALAVVGLVLVSGVVPINASSGHWSITYHLLDFIKRRSVATHSIGIDAPSLTNPSLVAAGASLYETGCVQCHGSPAAALPAIPQHMTPHPPDLRTHVARWTPPQLFYIVKHGIKFTGMPAWPAGSREDEVWAVVAFLRELPRMDARAYERLLSRRVAVATPVRGADLSSRDSADINRFVAEACERCHGPDGQGRDIRTFPKLSGQRAGYLLRAIQAFRNGTRHSGAMTPIAAGINDHLAGRVADYYAGVGRSPGASVIDAAAIARGAAIAARGIPAQRIPPCSECHGPGETDRNPAYPILDGQFQDYLVLQLQLFAAGRRGGSEYAHLMQRIAPNLTPGQMSDAAAYFASLTPVARPQ